jgi:hypothetical protein
MTRWDDLPDAMRGEKIDERTLDRSLRGRTAPDDAPPGYSDVASVLLAAASPPLEQELNMEAQHVAAARNAIGHRTTSARPIWRRRTLAGLMVVGGLLVIPGLAAANSLPDPAQHAVSRVFDKVGISVPDSHATAVDHPASTGSEISNIATTDATGVAKGALISSIASGGMSQAGQHGGATNPHGSARVPTPNTGGTGTADTASGGSADHGKATANQASGGRSAAGSSNAQSGHGSAVPTP